jgi:CheY-like chemotaxis protein
MSAQMITDLFRLDINTSRKGTEGESSSGLGLIICKDFIEKHGGSLWVESQEGKGSTFYFTLPSATAIQETQAGNNAVPERAKLVPDKNLKILIVENDKTSEILISIALEPYCKQILIAHNGIEAIEICRNNADIDLIMMDIQMPEMNGYDATRHIRQFNTKVIIIIQTAFVYIEDEQKALDSGSNEFITKPLNLETLKKLVLKYFSG